MPKLSDLLQSSIQLHFDFIDETPAPILAGLEGRNNGMPRSGGMIARMTIFRVIAQPTWPQVLHNRRCAQVSPLARHSTQPCPEGVTCPTLLRCV